MRQSATERRSLTLGQRVMINLEFSELVERLRAEAKARQGTRTDLGADLHQSSESPAGKVAEQIAKMSGTSARNVYKAQAVLREAPESCCVRFFLVVIYTRVYFAVRNLRKPDAARSKGGVGGPRLIRNEDDYSRSIDYS